MNHRLPHLAQRLFNRPLALQPQKAEIVMAALADRFGVRHFYRGDGLELPVQAGPLNPDDAAEEAEYQVINQIAVVPVHGTLVHRLGIMGAYSGMTGYDSIRASLFTALKDDNVRAIALDIDSCGGECSGLFDLVDYIHAVRDQKPIWAILNEDAFSAGYAIASAASYVTVPRSGGTGSIGILCLLTDISQALTKDGIAVNVFQFGDRKADGLDMLPLSPEARARIQGDINTLGNLFVNMVARNRSLSPAAVLAQQATTYMGMDGVTHGLADAVMAPDEAFRALCSKLNQ